VKQVDGGRLYRGVLVNTRVVDQDVDRAEGLLGFCEQSSHIGLVRYIALDRNGRAARISDGSHHFVGPFLIGGIVHHHFRPFGGKVGRNSSSNSFGGPGNYCYLVFQFAHL
jgi:hypothetical protein